MTTPAKIETWMMDAAEKVHDQYPRIYGDTRDTLKVIAAIAAHAPQEPPEWEAKEKALLELVKALLQKYWRSHPQP